MSYWLFEHSSVGHRDLLGQHAPGVLADLPDSPFGVPIAGSAPNGHDDHRTGDVVGEAFQVAGVTCVYVIAAPSGGLDDDGINDIGGSGAAAQLTGPAGRLFTERVRSAVAESLGQAGLATTIAPGLSGHDRWHGWDLTAVNEPSECRPGFPIVAVQRDEHAGIEGGAHEAAC